MGKPHQFTLRQVFLLALLFCIASPLIKALAGASDQDGLFMSGLFIGGATLIGVFTGALFGKPMAGALIGGWLGAAFVGAILLTISLASRG